MSNAITGSGYERGRRARPTPERLRKACNGCTNAKVKCSGEKDGCKRCLTLRILCIYEKSRVGKVPGIRAKKRGLSENDDRGSSKVAKTFGMSVLDTFAQQSEPPYQVKDHSLSTLQDGEEEPAVDRTVPECFRGREKEFSNMESAINSHVETRNIRNPVNNTLVDEELGSSPAANSTFNDGTISRPADQQDHRGILSLASRTPVSYLKSQVSYSHSPQLQNHSFKNLPNQQHSPTNVTVTSYHDGSSFSSSKPSAPLRQRTHPGASLQTSTSPLGNQNPSYSRTSSTQSLPNKLQSTKSQDLCHSQSGDHHKLDIQQSLIRPTQSSTQHQRPTAATTASINNQSEFSGLWPATSSSAAILAYAEIVAVLEAYIQEQIRHVDLILQPVRHAIDRITRILYTHNDLNNKRCRKMLAVISDQLLELMEAGCDNFWKGVKGSNSILGNGESVGFYGLGLGAGTGGFGNHLDHEASGVNVGNVIEVGLGMSAGIDVNILGLEENFEDHASAFGHTFSFNGFSASRKDRLRMKATVIEQELQEINKFQQLIVELIRSSQVNEDGLNEEMAFYSALGSRLSLLIENFRQMEEY